MHYVAEMKWKYTYKDMMDILEMLDVYDSIQKISFDRAKADAKNKSKTKGQ